MKTPCPVPDCEANCVNTLPMCIEHWICVPAELRAACKTEQSRAEGGISHLGAVQDAIDHVMVRQRATREVVPPSPAGYTLSRLMEWIGRAPR